MSKSVLCVLAGEVQHDSILNGGARGINPEISRIYTRASESDSKNGMRFSFEIGREIFFGFSHGKSRCSMYTLRPKR